MSMKTLSYTLLLLLFMVIILISVFCFTQTHDPYPTPNATTSPTPTQATTTTPSSTPNAKLTVTYLEVSRNESIIEIHFKLEPNSYIFQLDTASFHLTENGVEISTNTNDALVIGTQYSTLLFPTNNYHGTDYHLSNDVLPSDTIWIKQ